MEKVIEACKKYPSARIFNVDETGMFWRLMPRRSYLSTSEDLKTVRGTKGMHLKDRVSAFMCANADGSAKVDMAIIGKAKNALYKIVLSSTSRRPMHGPTRRRS